MNWKTVYHLKKNPFSSFLLYCESHKGAFCSNDVGARIIVNAIKNKNIEIIDNIEEIKFHDVDCIYVDEQAPKEIVGNIHQYSGNGSCWYCQRPGLCDRLDSNKCYDFVSSGEEITIVAH